MDIISSNRSSVVTICYRIGITKSLNLKSKWWLDQHSMMYIMCFKQCMIHLNVAQCTFIGWCVYLLTLWIANVRSSQVSDKYCRPWTTLRYNRRSWKWIASRIDVRLWWGYWGNARLCLVYFVAEKKIQYIILVR